MKMRHFKPILFFRFLNSAYFKIGRQNSGVSTVLARGEVRGEVMQ